MIHLISTGDHARISQALSFAERSDWLVITVENSLDKNTMAWVETHILTQFPNSVFLCENTSNRNTNNDNPENLKRRINYTDFLKLCEDHSPIMSWY